MVKVLLLISLLLMASTVPAIAQFDIPEINKLKEIRMLESNVFDVQRLLFDFKSDGLQAGDDEQWFYTENFSIDVYYSTGDCSGDEEVWSLPEGRVWKIEINSRNTLKVKDLGFDFSTFKKEQVWNHMPNTVVYHDKEKGFAFTVSVKRGEVDEIYLFASKSSQTKPCENDAAKEFLKYESWFGSKKLEDRVQEDSNLPPNVTELTLSESEILLVHYITSRSKFRPKQLTLRTMC